MLSSSTRRAQGRSGAGLILLLALSLACASGCRSGSTAWLEGTWSADFAQVADQVEGSGAAVFAEAMFADASCTLVLEPAGSFEMASTTDGERHVSTGTWRAERVEGEEWLLSLDGAAGDDVPRQMRIVRVDDDRIRLTEGELEIPFNRIPSRPGRAE